MIEADEGHGFVLWRRGDIKVVQLEELMIEHPADPDGVLGGVAIAEFSHHAPVADELIKERILEFGLPAVGGRR